MNFAMALDMVVVRFEVECCCYIEYHVWFPSQAIKAIVSLALFLS